MVPVLVSVIREYSFGYHGAPVRQLLLLLTLLITRRLIILLAIDLEIYRYDAIVPSIDLRLRLRSIQKNGLFLELLLIPQRLSLIHI